MQLLSVHLLEFPRLTEMEKSYVCTPKNRKISENIKIRIDFLVVTCFLNLSHSFVFTSIYLSHNCSPGISFWLRISLIFPAQTKRWNYSTAYSDLYTEKYKRNFKIGVRPCCYRRTMKVTSHGAGGLVLFCGFSLPPSSLPSSPML